MSEPRTVAELLDIGERVMADSTHIFEDHSNLDEAEELLAFATGINRGELEDEHVPTRRQRERFLALVARRAAGEPFPFLVGRIEFFGLDLWVKPGAFVPRPSSELTVERALRKLKRRADPVVVDVCTGSGPIALALGAELPGAEVWGLDISDEALNQGRRNARRLGIDAVRFRRGDMYSPLPRRLRGQVDLVTAHVPYVPPDEIGDLPTEVRGYEPIFTLTDQSRDGFDLLRRTIREAPEWLKPGGWLLLEIADEFSSFVERLCEKAGFKLVSKASDDDGLSVVVEASAGRDKSRRARPHKAGTAQRRAVG